MYIFDSALEPFSRNVTEGRICRIVNKISAFVVLFYKTMYHYRRFRSEQGTFCAHFGIGIAKDIGIAVIVFADQLITGFKGSVSLYLISEFLIFGSMYKQKGKSPLLVACDVYRPAAVDQLKIVGEQVGVPVFSLGTKVSPIEIAKAGIEAAKKGGHDMVFIDTAGRLHIDEELMEELVKIKTAVEPTEILLTVDAMLGQDAVNVAKTFNELLGRTQSPSDTTKAQGW